MVISCRIDDGSWYSIHPDSIILVKSILEIQDSFYYILLSQSHLTAEYPDAFEEFHSPEIPRGENFWKILSFGEFLEY